MSKFLTNALEFKEFYHFHNTGSGPACLISTKIDFMSTAKFDVFVIGTGTAGKIVAKDCARAGLKVAIADNREFGGTCALRGCDPKKVLVGVTEIIERARKMEGKGIVEAPKSNWADLMKFKELFVTSIPVDTEKDLEELGITMYHQSPQFLDKTTISVEGKTVQATNIVIATGNTPIRLGIPGEEHLLVSDDFLNLNELPESMIFIGAGYIGMEFAHIAARFGVKVSMIDTSTPLSHFDKDMAEALQSASEKIGIKFILNAEVTKIEKLKKNLRVYVKQDGKEINHKAAMVFNTAGRVPAIDALDLEKGKIKFTNKGISVNKHLQNTGNEHVYACGDVADSSGLPLTPLSSKEAQIVSHNLLNKSNRKEITYPAQPTVVFTLPNLASVGMLEKEARDKGYSYTVNHKDVSDWFNAKRINESTYAYKVIFDTKTGLILGAHIIGPKASEVINLFSMAISGKLDRDTLRKMVFGYPTWGGDFTSML